MKSLISISLFLLLIICSCSEDKNPTEPTGEVTFVSGNISVGEETQEISKEIGTNGGSLIISNPESPLNGLELIVPSENYSESRNYNVSSRPIENHKMGSNFNPVSPMITISNGGGYSEMPITIKVPIAKTEDEFLIGFYYNEVTGGLEALPVIELEDDYIIVETRHFALSTLAEGGGLNKTSARTSIGNLIISSIKESVIAEQTIISSGFTPGVDDWEFPNYGSFIAEGGHCAGQSMTAMWYYYEKKLKGEPSLFHRFDKINNSSNPRVLWQDNAVGYRFASTAQKDADWGNWVRALKIQSRYPKLVWKAFIVAMLVTGEPQSVIIRNSVKGGGHAMIIYKINYPEGKLYVADPNYPNNRTSNGEESIRTITFANGKLNPYPSFAKVGDPGVEYDQIAFYAKTAVFDWEKLGQRYKELEDKTIGNDRFLKYDLFLDSKTGIKLFQDGITVINDTLKLFCQNTNIPKFLTGTDRRQEINLYHVDGSFLAKTDNDGVVTIKLNSGENKFGIYVCGFSGTRPNYYYDYQWVSVNYQSPNPGLNDLNYNRVIVGAQIVGKFNSSIDNRDTSYTEVEELGSYFMDGSFSGNTFTGETEQFGSKQTISISVNEEHNLITSVTFSSLNQNTNTSGYVSYGFTGKNIPIDPDDPSDYEIYGNNTCGAITSAYYSLDNGGTIFTNLVGHSCDDNSHIFVSFSVK